LSIEDLTKEISQGAAKKQKSENPVHYIQFKKETLDDYNATIRPLNLTTDQEARLFLRLVKEFNSAHLKTDQPQKPKRESKATEKTA